MSNLNNLKHGHTSGGGRIKSPEYSAWHDMKSRCYNANVANYKHYGARGITVCEAWLKNFAQFLTDVGPKPNPQLQLDRINNDGNYEPGNVRWATVSQNLSNRRSWRVS